MNILWWIHMIEFNLHTLTVTYHPVEKQLTKACTHRITIDFQVFCFEAERLLFQTESSWFSNVQSRSEWSCSH